MNRLGTVEEVQPCLALSYRKKIVSLPALFMIFRAEELLIKVSFRRSSQAVTFIQNFIEINFILPC